MRRSSLARDVLVALVVAIVILTAPVASSGGTSNHVGVSAIAAVVPADDGGWWVVERSLQGQGGVAYRYTGRWKRTGEQHRIQLSPSTRFAPAGVASAKSGGWWILAANGTVHRFGGDWTYLDESHSLSHPHYDRQLTSGFGLTEANGGGWWVNVDRTLVRYTSNWTVANESVTSFEGVSEGYPVATAHEGEKSLWVLEGYLGTGVSRFPLAADGQRVNESATETVDADVGKIRVATPTNGYHLHSVVDIPIDLVQANDRWLVVDADGQVHRFDEYWRYTGTTYQVGSGDVEGTYPSDVIGLGTLLVPLIKGVVWVLPGIITVSGIAWQFRTERDRSTVVAGIGILAFVYGVTMQPYFLRLVVFAHPLLPLAVIVFVALGSISHLLRKRGPLRRVGGLLIAYVPLAIAIHQMVSVATRAVPV